MAPERKPCWVKLEAASWYIKAREKSQTEDEKFCDKRSKDGHQGDQCPVAMSLSEVVISCYDVRDDVGSDEKDREEEELEKNFEVVPFWVIFIPLIWNKQN